VTFVIGIKCMDGLVLAADSLEGDGVNKSYVTKLEVHQRPSWGMCWGGAGHARVVDKFSDKFKQCLKRVKEYDRNKIEAIMETCLTAIGKRYRYEDGITVVAGLYGANILQTIGPKPIQTVGMEWNLYKADSVSACASLQQFHCCAGTGDNSLANFLLRNVYFPGDRVLVGQKLTMMITALMKDYGDGVGGPTTVFSVTLGNRCQWIPLLNFQVEEIEKELPVKALQQDIRNIRKVLLGQFVAQEGKR